MKIAFVIPAISAGGAERVVARLAGYVAGQGADVTIFVERPKEVGYPLHRKVRLVQLPALDAQNLSAAIKQYKIDLISDHYHWSYQHILELVKLAQTGVKIVLSEHNSYFYPLFTAGHERDAISARIFEERAALYRNFCAVTSLTRTSANLLAAEGLDHIVLCYNPLSYDAQSRSDLSQPRLLNVSGFHKPAKRLDLLFEAMAAASQLYPGLRLRLVGEFDYLRYRQFGQDHNLLPASVEIIGQCDDVEPHYLASSIFTMTSEIEGQPMALLEAACHGIPQLVYDIPGIEDQIIDGETGFIIPPGDATQFAATVDRLMRDLPLRRRIGARAVEFVHQSFDLEKIGAHWLSLFRAVHETGAPGPALAWPLQGESPAEVKAQAAPQIAQWRAKLTAPASRPLVSVIVPVYGTEEYLPRCLESLCGQSLREIEIIVVNDASPGNCGDIVAEFQKSDRRVRLVTHPKNRGLYQARSTGAREAQGRYLAHVDSDDFVHTQFLRLMYEAALLEDADIVECAAVEVTTRGERKRFNPNFIPELKQPDLLAAFIDEKMRHVVWNKLYRKSVWDRAPFHMEEEREFSITEDLLRNAPIFATARKYRFIDSVLYYYIRREESVVTTGDFPKVFKKLEDLSYVYQKLIDFFKSRNIPHAKLARLREREMVDYGWYLNHGFSQKGSDIARRVEQAIAQAGAYGGVAVHQAAQLADYEQLKHRHWRLVQQHQALEEKLKQKGG